MKYVVPIVVLNVALAPIPLTVFPPVHEMVGFDRAISTPVAEEMTSSVSRFGVNAGDVTETVCARPVATNE